MTSTRYQLRALSVVGLLVAALLVLLGRMISLQVDAAPDTRVAAMQQHYRALTLPHVPRGAVLDRRGRVLAQTVMRKTVGLDPKTIARDGNGDEVRALFLEEAGVDVAPLLAERIRIADDGRRIEIEYHHVIRKTTDEELVARLHDRAFNVPRKERLRGVVFTAEPVRVYPAGTLASHVVGFTRECEDGVRGVLGVERLADERLRGRRETVETLRDGRSRVVRLGSQGRVRAVPGENVRLTLDAHVQAHAERLLDGITENTEPTAAVAVVVDVLNGDVLAMASRPGFDANEPMGELLPGAELTKEEQRRRVAAQRNRVLTDTYPPGSVFKPIAMAIAMEAGAVFPGQTIDCSGGRLELGSRLVREDKWKDLGVLTPSTVLSRSSNVGMAQIAVATGIEPMRAGVKRFGFGRLTGSGWPKETAGLLVPDERWSVNYTLASVSFGQAMSASPMQVAMAYAAVANGGLLHTPRVFEGRPGRPPVRVLRAEVAAALHPMMEAVFTDALGTAHRRLDECGGYRLAGKTGTAQVMRRGRRVDGHVASFGCFGPVESPRLAVLVMADRPRKGKHYGGVVAAPAAIELMRDTLRYLGVDPLPPARSTGALDAAGPRVAAAPLAPRAPADRLLPLHRAADPGPPAASDGVHAR